MNSACPVKKAIVFSYLHDSNKRQGRTATETSIIIPFNENNVANNVGPSLTGFIIRLSSS